MEEKLQISRQLCEFSDRSQSFLSSRSIGNSCKDQPFPISTKTEYESLVSNDKLEIPEEKKTVKGFMQKLVKFRRRAVSNVEKPTAAMVFLPVSLNCS